MKLLVLGGGVAGLATALATSRGGHEVVLLERDAGAPAGGDAAQVFESSVTSHCASAMRFVTS